MYLKGLDEFVGLSFVHPVFQRTRPNDPEDKHFGWAFVDPAKTLTLPGPTGIGAYSSEGSTPDEINGAAFVRDLYEKSAGKGVTGRYTVPLLWDNKEGIIVSNESADIVRMFNAEFNDLVSPAAADIDLYPEELHAEIDAVNEWVYSDINNGVYKCGFAQSQEAYDEAANALFASLDRAEAILSEHRFLVGDRFTEADLRLFVTLIRFDEVYAVHFKTCKKLIQQYPNLSNVRLRVGA
jgi:putative glutathione S-transferase